jgi:hypothetical protein
VITGRHERSKDLGNGNARLCLVQFQNGAHDARRSAHGGVQHVDVIRLKELKNKLKMFSQLPPPTAYLSVHFLRLAVTNQQTA